MSTGRPTKYKPEYAKQAEMAALAGFTDEQVSDLFSVNVDTIYEWKKVHEDFSEALKKGKAQHDDGTVVQALLKSALGYDVEQGEHSKHYPPNATSLIFWLKNRQPDKWNDKRIQQHEGEVNFSWSGDDEDD